jgi:hypothetical protein
MSDLNMALKKAVEQLRDRVEAAREIGKAFEGLALALEEGLVEDESVICLAVACDEFFAEYREMVGKPL